MSNWHKLLKIEGVGRRYDVEVIGRPRYIQQHSRPATAGIAHTPVLNVPGSEPTGSEIFSQACHEVEAITRSPVSTMDEYDRGARASACGQIKIAKLQGFWSIRQPDCFVGR